MPNTTDAIELYGTVPDVQIGKLIGRTSQMVGRRRRALSIEAYSPRPRVDWSVWDKHIGKTTDSHLARLIVCDQTTVSSRRRRLGIPRYRSKILRRKSHDNL